MFCLNLLEYGFVIFYIRSIKIFCQSLVDICEGFMMIQ